MLHVVSLSHYALLQMPVVALVFVLKIIHVLTIDEFHGCVTISLYSRSIKLPSCLAPTLCGYLAVALRTFSGEFFELFLLL